MRSRPIGRSAAFPAVSVWCIFWIAPVLFADGLCEAAGQASLGDRAQVELLQRTLADVADMVRPSVVAIRSERQFQPDEETEAPDDEVHRGLRNRVFPSVGSGVIISADGLILTNEHVVRDAELDKITCILSSGDSYPVQGITSDPRSDLAVLRLDAADLQPIRMGDVANVRQGHFVIVMGNPFGSATENSGRPVMSFGVISALGQQLTRQLDPMGERYYGNLIQTDAKINPGNSGGPLLNLNGELIGINTAISTRSGGSEGVGYAISIDKRTKEIIATLARAEEVAYGYLGVDLGPPSPADRTAAGAPRRGGALVKSVRRGTPAAAAQLQEGDLIMEFDGQRVLDHDHLVRLVGGSRADTEVTVVVYRNRNPVTLSVVPGRRPIEIRPINTYAMFPWRGMKLAELTPALRRSHKLDDAVQGALVTEIEPSGSAQKAGVHVGQVLRQVGDVQIEGLRRLRDIAPSLAGPLKIILADGKGSDQEVTLP